jgi:TetR/AcrR family fatty acid metabolism transcriptional regulator
MATVRRASPAPKKPNGKYEAILRAAIKVFAGSGFFNSKVADVAREAGVADGTVYLYFKNKDDILASIFNQYMDEALAAGRARLAELNDPIEKLRRIVHAHLEGLGRDRNLAVVFQVELRSSTNSLEQFRLQSHRVPGAHPRGGGRPTKASFMGLKGRCKGAVRSARRDGNQLGAQPRAIQSGINRTAGT